VQIAQLVLERGIVRAFLTRRLLCGMPRGMRERRLLREQEGKDAEKRDESSPAHVSENGWPCVEQVGASYPITGRCPGQKRAQVVFRQQ
jgi:hypothetical protein